MRTIREVYALFLCCVLALVPDSFPQNLSTPVSSQGSPHFWLDLNGYARGEEYSVELYYSVSFDQLTFSAQDNQLLASFSVSLAIKDQSNNDVLTREIAKKARAASEEESRDPSKGIIDQIKFSLPTGSYSFQFSLSDIYGNRSSTASGVFELEASDSSLTTSPLELATLISETRPQDPFSKGTKSVLPNPSRRYTQGKSILYLYFEIYNMKTAPVGQDNQYALQYVVTDRFGDSLLVTPLRRFDKPGSSAAKMEAIDIRGLDAGQYLLAVLVKDPATGQSTASQSLFYIRPPATDASTLPMTQEDIKRYRDQIKYIATREELALYDNLVPEDKGRFLVNFWKSRDTSPETEENEYMMDYFSRFNYAAKNFRGKEGGENSDMGRVFIIYGQPDDIERYDMHFETKAYQIWHYFTAGGRHSFVFVDYNNEGIYTLVHSSVEEEIKNANWRESEIH